MGLYGRGYPAGSMPAMPWLMMKGGREPGSELLALTDAEDEEDETAGAVVVVAWEDEEVVAAPAPFTLSRSGYMYLGSPS